MMCIAQNKHITTIEIENRVNVELIKKNKFCKGMKVGHHYRCINEIKNQKTINHAVDLLIEALNRITYWHIDTSEWLEKYRRELLEIRRNVKELSEKYDGTIYEFAKTINSLIKYVKKFEKKYVNISNEIRELISKIENGCIKIIVRESSNGTLYIVVKNKHITLKVSEPTSSKSKDITVVLYFEGFRGIKVMVPDVIGKILEQKDEKTKELLKEIIEGLKIGFASSDELMYKCHYAAMETAKIRQMILWLLLYPGKTYVHINGINVNKKSVAIRWFLVSSHNSLKNSIATLLNKAGINLAIPALYTAIVGDGNVDIKKLRIQLATKDISIWIPIIEKLGIRWRPSHGKITRISYYSSHAVELARLIVNTLQELHDLLNAVGEEKWVIINEIAKKELRRRGEAQVIVAGERFTVHTPNWRTVILMRRTKSSDMMNTITQKLKERYSNDALIYTHTYRDFIVIEIPIKTIINNNDGDVMIQIIKVLCKKIIKAKNEKIRKRLSKLLMKYINMFTEETVKEIRNSCQV
ncbi:hypothetical protein GCM10007112_18110 [Vulcanisaeta souniana JCM 11219]|uniref:Uncharacterized protein n=3 Tax=Vulcanisaeta souniana TaxID=164452 RepID=A0A830EG17_9CREN|nr:hypothetical protein GCM10007112_18110 [Vulcanisaeta souniana JCM 11219]